LENNFSSALCRSSDKEVTFWEYPHLTALRRKTSILVVSSTVRNPRHAGKAYKIRQRIIAQKTDFGCLLEIPAPL